MRLPRDKFQREEKSGCFCVYVLLVNLSHIKLLLSERKEKFLLWMEAHTALHTGYTSIRKATKWFPWWLQLSPVPRILSVYPANSLGHVHFLWLWSTGATKYHISAWKVQSFFLEKNAFVVAKLSADINIHLFYCWQGQVAILCTWHICK